MIDNKKINLAGCLVDGIAANDLLGVLPTAEGISVSKDLFSMVPKLLITFGLKGLLDESFKQISATIGAESATCNFV